MQNALATAPAWFRPEAGFRFLDAQGDLVVVLGEGSYRDAEIVTPRARDSDGEEHNFPAACIMIFKPEGFLIATRYKKEWHIWDLTRIQDSQPYWNGARPL